MTMRPEQRAAQSDHMDAANPSAPAKYPAQFATQLTAWQARVEEQLAQRLPQENEEPRRLVAAMRYSVLGGGKRVRPALTYATASALGLSLASVDGVACAVEMIHAYSLIHDDLPAMDDDDLRRGQPTCHKAFDEATAILAGDALQVLAFQVLASGPGLPSDCAVRLRLVQLLAAASGIDGMAGGQALDLAATGQQLSIEQVDRMHGRKTGALIEASVSMAASCAPDLAEQTRSALQTYARAIGLAFQIQDDLLDVEGDPALLGKATGADQALNKPTYPAILGIEPARERMLALHARALEALAAPGIDPRPLTALSDWLVLRRC